MLLFYTVANDFSSVAAYIPTDKSRGFTLLLVNFFKIQHNLKRFFNLLR